MWGGGEKKLNEMGKEKLERPISGQFAKRAKLYSELLQASIFFQPHHCGLFLLVFFLNQHASIQFIIHTPTHSLILSCVSPGFTERTVRGPRFTAKEEGGGGGR